MTFTIANSKKRIPLKKNIRLKILLATFIIIWGITLAGTPDLNNWLLENVLVFLFIILLYFIQRKYQLSDLSFLLIFLFMSLHVYGSMFTYAENPFGYWLKDQFDWKRNHYDRIVHFSFGFLLAYPMREVFIKWLKFPSWSAWILPIIITLAFGSFYEVIEFAVADIFFPEQGMAYLGTQGDEWDAQKDNSLSALGAVLASTIISSIKKLGRMHLPY